MCGMVDVWLHAPGDQRKTLGTLVYHSLPSLETESLTGPEAQLIASKPQDLPISGAIVLGLQVFAVMPSFFMLVLGVETQVLTLLMPSLWPP